MDIRNLIKMANQIGGFFSTYPDKAEASNEIASHLEKFWTPRMRMQLIEYVDNSDGDGLKDMVTASIKLYRHKLKPKN